MRFIDPSAIQPLRVVLDGTNGMAGPMIGPLLERLPITAIPHHLDPDGSFPNGEPNPLIEENRRFIVEQVVAEGADLGIAWDGDADRCFFIDDTGEFVPGDLITVLIARTMLERHPGATIVYDLRASWAVRDTVAAAGGTALENRVGHAFIKARLRKEEAVFAGEVSGHYYFKDFYYCDTGIVPALVMLELISRSGQKLSAAAGAVPGAVPHLRRDQLDRGRRAVEAAGAEGPVRPVGGAGVAPGRHLVRVPRLALQRTAVEHGAAAAAEPGGVVGRDDGAAARRGARGDHLLMPATDRRPPFHFSYRTRVGFDETDAQGIVYYGRYMPYFDRARVEYLRELGVLVREPSDPEFVMRAQHVEYHAPASFDDELEVFVRVRRIGTTSLSWEFEAYKVSGGDRLVAANQTLVSVDLAERQPVPVEWRLRDAIAGFEPELEL